MFDLNCGCVIYMHAQSRGWSIQSARAVLVAVPLVLAVYVPRIALQIREGAIVCAPRIHSLTQSQPSLTHKSVPQRLITSAIHDDIVLHGESSKRLASPRNTKDRKHLQSTQSAKPTHLTDQALPKRQPGRRITPINTAAVHASAQQQPTIITHTRQGHHQILSANAARCEAQEQYRRAG